MVHIEEILISEETKYSYLCQTCVRVVLCHLELNLGISLRKILNPANLMQNLQLVTCFAGIKVLKIPSSIIR